jgi:hypothetical protein
MRINNPNFQGKTEKTENEQAQAQNENKEIQPETIKTVEHPENVTHPKKKTALDSVPL